jgi:hypothetical protein
MAKKIRLNIPPVKGRNPLVLSMILNPKRNTGFKSKKKEASKRACRKRDDDES